MKERFTKLPAYFYEDGRIWFHDLYLNLFQIEGFIEVDIAFTNEEGEEVYKEDDSRISKKNC